MICILDWYHIKQKFDTLIGQLDDSRTDELGSIKWEIWHGKSQEAVTRLQALYNGARQTKFSEKLSDLLTYIRNNKSYLVNYKERKDLQLTFTSSVIESSVEKIINERFKKKSKAQWTRKGAHKVLQVRTLIKSGQWDEKWLSIQDEFYKKSA